MKLRYYLHSKAAANGKRPVYISIGIGEPRPVRAATGVVVHPSYFSDTFPHIHRNADGATSAIDRLDDLRLQATRAVRRLEDAGQLTNEHLSRELKKILAELTGRKSRVADEQNAGPVGEVPLGEQSFRAVYARWKAEKAGKFSDDYLAKGSQYVDWFERFDKAITPARVSQSWVDRYTAYLVKDTPMFNNTIAQHINSLRVLMQFAGVPTKWITNDWEHDIEPVYLTQQELEQLMAWQPPEGRKSWERQKDVFLMRCLTGLRYSDAAALLRPHIKQAAALRMIRMDQQKTKSSVQIPLLPLVEEIIRKYEHLPAGQVLPVISRQQTGDVIKQILKAAGITSDYIQVRYKGTVKHEKVLPKWEAASTHTARHTYGALLARMKLHPLQIMEKMGHRDLKSTLKYTHLEHEATEQQMLEGWQKLNPGKPED